MRIAICYSGMYRGFDQNIDNHMTYLIDQYDCDIYINFWDIHGWGWVAMQTDSHRNDLNEEKKQIYNQHAINKITENDLKMIKQKINNIQFKIDSFEEFESQYNTLNLPLNIGPPYLKNVLSMYYSIKECAKLITNKNKYDLIVRMRGDLFFTELVKLKSETKKIYYNSLGSWSDDAINDTFLYGCPETMESLNGIYNYIIQQYQKFILVAPEIILGSYLHEYKINKEKHNIYYKIRRLNNQLD